MCLTDAPADKEAFAFGIGAHTHTHTELKCAESGVEVSAFALGRQNDNLIIRCFKSD